MNRKKKRKSKSAKQKDQILLDLPNDLIQLVVSHLPLKENILVSSVCKSLRDACVSVRVRVEEKSPWLMSSFVADGSYKLYDPSMEKTYSLEVPEISGFQVEYAKDGWLLMCKQQCRRTCQLLFFNPFTRDSIHVLPPLCMVSYVKRMAFSCAPTSSSCVLFTISYDSNNITIKTCSPNAKEWNTFVFKNLLPEYNYRFKQIVFSNGVFYCLTDNSYLTIFNPSLNSWNIVPKRLPIYPKMKGFYLTEHQEKIFFIYTYYFLKRPKVFTLDHTSWEWTMKKKLGGLTIYISDLSCETRAEKKHPSGIRDRLCFTSLYELNRTCFSTFFKDDHEIIIYDKSSKLDFYGDIWIIPPSNLLDFPFFHHILK